MYLLNYIYFLIITLLGLKFLTMKRGVMVNPLNREQKMVMDGPEMFWVLTFSTGLLALSAPGALDLMAIRLMVLEIFCIVGLFICKRSPQWSPAIVLYLLYIVWLVIGLSYSPAPGYGFRIILKYLYPLLIMLFASATVRDKEVFLKAGLGARLVAVISIPVLIIPMLNWILFPGVFWYGTASAIHYITMCVFSLALFYYTDERRKNLLLCVLFMLPCMVWVFRTSIMGTTLALMTFFFFKYKLKSLPVIFTVFVLFVVAVLAIPSVREKMFFDDSDKSIAQLNAGEISMDDINSNGRFAMWEWSLDKFFHNKELTGTGTGNLQETFYALRHPFGSIRICHNDYVQILCDNGLIGIVLFGSSFFALIFHCFIVFQNRRYNTAIHICAIIAGSSAAGTLLTMYTDNVINYTMATLSYPCGFYGMMLGLIVGYKQK